MNKLPLTKLKTYLLALILTSLMLVTRAATGSVGAFELRIPAPGPDAIADTVFQDAIDAVAAAGGGVVLLGVGDFKLSRHAGDETVVIKSNVRIRGQGYANLLRQAGPITLHASQWVWSGNTHVNGTLEIPAGAQGNIIRDNVTATPITPRHGNRSGRQCRDEKISRTVNLHSCRFSCICGGEAACICTCVAPKSSAGNALAGATAGADWLESE